MEAIVFIIFQIFFANARSFENWEVFSDVPQFYRGIFGHVMCLDQSHASENI